MLIKIWDNFIRSRIGLSLGALLFLVGAGMYRSFENHAIWDRWSFSYAAIMAMALLAVCYAIAISVWTYLGKRDEPSIGQTFLDLAMLVWGGGYLISAMDDPSNGGNIADFNVVGTTTPAAILLEWLAIVFVGCAFVSLVWKKREQYWGHVGLLLCSVFLVLVMCEGLIRAWRCVSPVVQGFPTNSSTLWSRMHVQLNHLGYRDVEHIALKRSDEYRLLVIGDSFAFGWGIDRIENRFGEVLAEKLHEKTGSSWEVVNVSQPNTHTLDHITFLESTLRMQPDVVILLYVFNDIDYLRRVTPRDAQAEMPQSVLGRMEPARILYRNSYLFQELYVRARLLSYSNSSSTSGGLSNDPYDDSEVMGQHMQDLETFVSKAHAAGARTFLIPFDISVLAEASMRTRYQRFIQRTTAVGLPTLSTEDAFRGYNYYQLTVNTLDRHPNEVANRMMAEAVVGQLVGKL